ncbi:MAG: glycosyltransferase [Tissierellia bacterium]|nr:glycosyltransferase [Tissierellia bacterium]
MKVLITTDSYYPVVNGVVRSTLYLKKYLEDRNIEVRVLTLSNKKSSYVKDNVYYIGSVDIGRIYPDARLSMALKSPLIKELIQFNPDIIHSQCEFSTFFMAKRIRKFVNCPIVHTYHTIYEDYTHYFSPSKKWGKFLVKRFTKAIVKRSDYVIAPTQKTKTILEKYDIDPKKIRIIPTGIKIEPLDNIDYKQKIGFKNQKIILYLGRLAKEKNIDWLIDSYKKIKPDAKFIIAGFGPHSDQLKKKAEGSDIYFAGEISPAKVIDYYRASDVFVSASTSETQGLTYLEALSAPTVAICKKDNCLDNVIIDDYNGYQFEDFEDFKKKLTDLLNNKQKRDFMKENAYRHALENFSYEAFGQKVLKLYEEAINEIEENNDFRKLNRA